MLDGLHELNLDLVLGKTLFLVQFFNTLTQTGLAYVPVDVVVHLEPVDGFFIELVAQLITIHYSVSFEYLSILVLGLYLVGNDHHLAVLEHICNGLLYEKLEFAQLVGDDAVAVIKYNQGHSATIPGFVLELPHSSVNNSLFLQF